MGVAEHEIGGSAPAGSRAVRRHRMAVDQQAGAETGAGLGDQLRPARRGTAASRCGCAASASAKRQLAAVDRLAGGDDAGDRAEPRADAGAGGVDPGRQRVGEHRRVELPGLAVGVAPGAREGGGEQRGAVLRGRGEQLVDEAVLAAAQAQRIEAGGGEEAAA